MGRRGSTDDFLSFRFSGVVRHPRDPKEFQFSIFIEQ